MDIPISELAALAGVTTRTLRHYHQIGLLVPQKTLPNGYRVYGVEALFTLQQILFYKGMGFELGEIPALLHKTPGAEIEVFRAQMSHISNKINHLYGMQHNLKKLINTLENGEKIMQDKLFEPFKREQIEKNEKMYGMEIRERYGEESVQAANQKLQNMSEKEYTELEKQGQAVLENLDKAFALGDITCAYAMKAAEAHQKWLQISMPNYNEEIHQNLCEMYIADPRFAEYYNRGIPEKAEFLRSCVMEYLLCSHK